jgi:ABC-2 type transport system ATP-binding protein
LVRAVVVEGLSKAYAEVQAVSDVSFSVEAGEVFALLGPNGAGKTTILEILEGFRRADGGRVEVLGFDPSNRATSRAMRERIGVVLQELAVEPFLTVRQVLERNASYYPRARRLEEVIELVGLKEKETARVNTLSGGQLRRLDLGLGIIGSPELLYLDEPTTGFDPSARRGSWEVVRALTAGGTTVILTTHYMDEAEALADRVAVLRNGHIVAEGAPTSLGGRDVSEAKIRFRLTGRPPADLSATVLEGPPQVFEINTDKEVQVLNELTAWSLRTGNELIGLTCERLTLEDVYLRLTATGAPEAPKQGTL